MLDTKSWKISQPCLLSDQPRPPPPSGGPLTLAFLIIRTSLCFCQEKNLLLTNVCPFLHSFRIVQNRTVQSSFLLVLFQYLSFTDLCSKLSVCVPQSRHASAVWQYSQCEENNQQGCSIVTVTVFSLHGQYLMDGELRSNNFMCFCCNLIRLLPHFTTLCGES